MVEGRRIRAVRSVDDAEALGAALAERLAGRGRGRHPGRGAGGVGPCRVRAVSAGAVVLTVSPGSFPGLADGLRGLRLEVKEIPLLTFAPPDDWAPVDRALRELSRYDALAFTSPRAATAFIERYRADGEAPRVREARCLPVWSGGSGTAGCARPTLRRGATVRRRTRAGGSARRRRWPPRCWTPGWPAPCSSPAARSGATSLPTRLRHEGIEVDEVVCYRSVLAATSPPPAPPRSEPRSWWWRARASPSCCRARLDRATPAAHARGRSYHGRGSRARPAGHPPPWPTRPDVEALLAGVRTLLAAASAT